MINHIFKDRKGVVSVWLTLMIFVLAMGFIVLYSFLFKQYERNEMIRRMELSSRWVLSHYDMKLYERYGLLGYDQDYLSQTQIFEQNLTGAEVVLAKEHSLGEGVAFTKQALRSIQMDLLKEGVECLMAENAASRVDDEMVSESLERGKAEIAKQADENNSQRASDLSEVNQDEAQNIKTRLDQLTKEQNERKAGSNRSVENAVKIPDEQINKMKKRELGEKASISLIETQLFNEYILSRFKSRVLDRHLLIKPKGGQTFVENSEIDFILQGHSNTVLNQSVTQGEILATRGTINALHLLLCKNHQTTISTMSLTVAAVFPLAEPLVYASLVLTWASLESVDELKALEQGDGISKMKMTDTAWRTDFMPTNKSNQSGLESSISELYYSDCLRLMLNLRSHEQKLNRMMTLIELNLSSENQRPYELDHLITSHRVTMKWRHHEYQYSDGYAMDRDGRYLEGPKNEKR